MATKAELEARVLELEAENNDLRAQLESKSAEKVIRVKDNQIPGTYKAEDGRVFKFKDGFKIVHIVGRDKMNSEELIKNKGGKYTEVMEELIAMGYGGLEEVK